MRPVVEHSTYIGAPPEEVYRALTTSEGLNSWFTTDAEVDASAGGRIVFRWRDFGVDRIAAEDGGPVLEAVPGKRFVFQWSPAGPEQATTVRFELSPYGDGTRLDVTEEGFPDDPEKAMQAILMVGPGWGEAATLLTFHLENPAGYRHPCTWHQVLARQPA